jgi:protein-tyrosine-phosphatase
MERLGKKKVLFLCTGNYYRSRFAEVLFKRTLDQQCAARMLHLRTWKGD